LLELLFVKNFIVGKRSHVAWQLAVGVAVGNGQVGLESGNKSLGDDGVETFFKRNVFVHKLGGLNFIGDMESLDSLANVLNGLDDLGGRGSGGQHVNGVELLFKEKFSGVGSVHEGTGLRFHANLVLLRLLSLLGKQSVLLNGESFLHGL